MTPVGAKPTKYKPYYDVFTWLVTQLAFSFTTAPFILLTAQASLQVWAAVYFYCVVGVALGNMLLLTPVKSILANKVKARGMRPTPKRNESQESLQGEMLGVPTNPSEQWDEMVDEIVQEVKRRRGNKPGPEGHELRKMVEESLHEEKEKERDGQVEMRKSNKTQ